MNEIEYSTIMCMQKYGSRFNKCLAELMLTADDVNFRILKQAFPETFEHYKEVNRREDMRDGLGYELSAAYHRHLVDIMPKDRRHGHPINTIAKR